MKYNRLVLNAIVVLILTLAFAGCGKSEGDNGCVLCGTSPTVPSTTPAPTPTPTAHTPVVVTPWLCAGSGDQPCANPISPGSDGRYHVAPGGYKFWVKLSFAQPDPAFILDAMLSSTAWQLGLSGHLVRQPESSGTSPMLTSVLLNVTATGGPATVWLQGAETGPSSYSRDLTTNWIVVTP